MSASIDTGSRDTVIALLQFGRNEKDRNPCYLNWHHDFIRTGLAAAPPKMREAIVDALRSAADDLESEKVDKYNPDRPFNSDVWPWEEM